MVDSVKSAYRVVFFFLKWFEYILNLSLKASITKLDSFG